MVACKTARVYIYRQVNIDIYYIYIWLYTWDRLKRNGYTFILIFVVSRTGGWTLVGGRGRWVVQGVETANLYSYIIFFFSFSHSSFILYFIEGSSVIFSSSLILSFFLFAFDRFFFLLFVLSFFFFFRSFFSSFHCQHFPILFPYVFRDSLMHTHYIW